MTVEASWRVHWIETTVISFPGEIILFAYLLALGRFFQILGAFDVASSFDKRCDLGYRSGKRDGMEKIKNFLSADWVVGGFRYATGGKLVGSLLLGLYDGEGLLNHVGFTSNLATAVRPALTKKLERLIEPPGFTGNAPGGPSRWNRGKQKDWQPLKPKLVVEVRFDHVTANRFRHGTKLIRWRPDKAPKQCTVDQLAQKQSVLLRLLR